MHFSNKRMVIIGGTSGIGLASAKLAVLQGAEVVVTGLNAPKEVSLPQEIKKHITYAQLDISDEAAVKAFFSTVGAFDYLTTPGSTTPKGPFLTMDTPTAKSGFESKFWGQYYAAKYAAPQLKKDGAIVLFSGIISQRPQQNLVIMGAVNSAVEGLGRALAIELAPIRVNVLSPGFVDTPRYAGMREEDRAAMFANLSQRLLVKHIGKPEELAQAVLFLMSNTFITGTTLLVDGGHLLT